MNRITAGARCCRNDPGLTDESRIYDRIRGLGDGAVLVPPAALGPQTPPRHMQKSPAKGAL